MNAYPSSDMRLRPPRNTSYYWVTLTSLILYVWLVMIGWYGLMRLVRTRVGCFLNTVFVPPFLNSYFESFPLFLFYNIFYVPNFCSSIIPSFFPFCQFSQSRHHLFFLQLLSCLNYCEHIFLVQIWQNLKVSEYCKIST